MNHKKYLFGLLVANLLSYGTLHTGFYSFLVQIIMKKLARPFLFARFCYTIIVHSATFRYIPRYMIII